MNHQDFLSTVAKHQPCTSRDLYLPLLERGYYSTKPENEAIEDISKVAHYLKTKGMLISEKQTGSFGVRNVWSISTEAARNIRGMVKTETETKEEPMPEHTTSDDYERLSIAGDDEEMASDVAELDIDAEPEPRQFIARVTRLTVGPKGEDIFSDRVTHIEIDDEGLGEYLKIMQGEETFSGIRVDVDEWPAIAGAIDMMIEHIQANAPTGT